MTGKKLLQIRIQHITMYNLIAFTNLDNNGNPIYCFMFGS